MESISKIGFLIFCINIIALPVHISGETFLVDLESPMPDWLTTNCLYAEDYMDFWVYGCRSEPDVDRFPANKGYWTACKTKTCFFAIEDAAAIDLSLITIQNYMEGNAKILLNISLPLSVRDTGSSNIKNIINEISASATNTWNETYLDVSSLNVKSINITIVLPRDINDGYALFDKITFYTGPIPTTTEENDSPTTTEGRGPTTTTEGSASTSAAQILCLLSGLAILSAVF